MILTVRAIAVLVCLREVSLSAAGLSLCRGRSWLLSLEFMADFYPGARIRFLFDCTALVFLRRVCCIASAVLAFSTSYIKSEPFYGRFHALVAVFVLAILILILRPDFLTLIIG